MEPFPSLTEEYIFLVIFGIWGLSLLMERFVTWRRHRLQSSRMDKGTYILINTIVIISVILSISLGVHSIVLLDPAIFYTGIIFLISGIAIRELSFFTLGSFFTFHIEISDTPQLIDYGLYQYIRHPSYSGLILELVGISLCMRSLVGVLLVIILCLTGIGLRINFEEEAMLATFGDEYREYQAKTKKLIPLLY